MVNEQHFSNLIYEYFLLRFEFGFYQFGDVLPPVETFCREFSVAENTVKIALRRLRTEGYIDMRGGRSTTVLFKQTELKRQDFISSYFSKRWDAYADLYASSELIFIPLLLEGLRRMSKDDLDSMAHLAEQAGGDDLLHFSCLILKKINNPLAMNLFWETLFFLGFPFAGRKTRPTQYTAETVQKRLKTLISGAKSQSWDMVHDALIEFQRCDYSNVANYLNKNVPHLPKEDQFLFTWRIYRDHPQICYNLSAHILHEIYIGNYRGKKFLPSYSATAKHYGVSVSTVRRTITTLNQIGAVQPINGKGVRICPIGEPCKPVDFSDATIRRNLSFYVQSFDLIRYTCEGVTHAFVSTFTPSVQRELIERLENELFSGHCIVSIFHFFCSIIKNEQMHMVSEVYRIIYSLFLWGAPLKGSTGKTPALEQAAELFTKRMLQYLKKNDADGCAATVKVFIDDQAAAAENFLLQQGICLEELRLSPSIRFLVAKN